MEMLDARCSQVPHGWITGDDELGRHTWFRQALRERDERYVLSAPPAFVTRKRCHLSIKAVVVV